MISKHRWTMMAALALAGSVCFAGLDARAAEPLRLTATHQQLATKSNQDGTATVTLAITLTNARSVAAEDVRLILLKGPGLPVMPGENVLTVGTLAAGQTATLSWPIKVLAPIAATRGDLPLMLIHAEGVAGDGTTPVGTGVLSRARYHTSAGSASDLVTADAAIPQCPVRGRTERVSVDSAGNQGNNWSESPAISADGRFVAFASTADNLIPGDTNGVDIFVHDRKGGTTERVSVESYSFEPAISADGRFVAFDSWADNLVPGGTNACEDIPCPKVFVYDRKTGATERVSVDSAGNEGSYSFEPAISADGRFVAFVSEADNLVSGDTNGWNDVFVHDRKTGATERISVDSAGNQGNTSSWHPAISADGRFVAFVSGADNLVPGDTNACEDIPCPDVFVHDRKTGATERVSVDSAGNQGNDYSYEPAISADGRFVAFASSAENLVPGDANGWNDVFVHDRKTGATKLVSVDSTGNQSNDVSFDPEISADGRFVAFSSDADNLVPGDTNGTTDVFAHDRETGAMARVSVDSAGNQGNSYSLSSAISADGRFVAFWSYAGNLVPGDTNATVDVFVHDRKTKVAETDGADLAGE